MASMKNFKRFLRVNRRFVILTIILLSAEIDKSKILDKKKEKEKDDDDEEEEVVAETSITDNDKQMNRIR
jgi:hypothetical protein